MNLKENATIVDALGSSLRSGGNALDTVPALLGRILREGMWREFITQRGELVQHERFVDFVTARPLKGIGATVELVRRIVENDPEVLDLLDQALQGQQGKRTDLVDNINEVERPTGTSKEYALRRLRASAPELHAQVLAGAISAHAAMIEAGFRRPTFTVRGDDPAAVAAALRRKLPPDVLGEVVRLLASAE